MPRVVEEPPPRRPAYFWWALANGLALCFAIVSWVTCLSIFRHPENPRNYEILRKLKRLPVVKDYESLKAPAADALLPAELMKYYGKFSPKVLDKLNPSLMQNYLNNFERSLLLKYVEGSYRVESCRQLKDDDFIHPGFVVRCRAMVKPDEFTAAQPYPVIVEYIFPTVDPVAFSWFKPGDTLSISKALNFAAVVHVAKIKEHDEELLCLTVVPIVYDTTYRVGDGREFDIKLPPVENFKPGGKLPAF